MAASIGRSGGKTVGRIYGIRLKTEMDCLFSTSCGSGGRGKGANKWNETGTMTGVLSTRSRFNIGKTVK
jgi:hypothetical protein